MALNFYSLVVPNTGYAQKLPTITPSPQNPTSQMSVTANPSNSGPVSVGSANLLPGASISLGGVADPGALFLRGAAGDGIGYTY